MENKVVNSLLNNNDGVKYHSRLTVCKHEGAGNNWAAGFFKLGKQVEDQVYEAVEAIARKSNGISGPIVLIASAAGGTGSGVGSRITRLLSKKNYDVIVLLVWPTISGEISVQQYNASLALAHIHKYARLVILIENDRYSEIAGASKKNVNRVIASHVESLFLPASWEGLCSPKISLPLSAEAAGFLNNNDKDTFEQLAQYHEPPTHGYSLPLFTILATLVNARFRIATIRHVPQIANGSEDWHKETWTGLIRRTAALLNEGKTIDGPSLTFKNHIWRSCAIFRGKNIAQLWDTHEQSLDLLKNIAPILGSTGSLPESITTISICQTPFRAIQVLQSSATALMNSGAFIYQYETHGLSVKRLAACIAEVKRLLEAGEELTEKTIYTV